MARIELPDLPAEADWSVCLRDAASGEVLGAAWPERVLRTASVGKIFLLIECARAFAAGELDPAEPLRRTPELMVADSGVWYLLATDALPAADLCTLVGAFSDNLATNVLIERVGIDAVAATGRALGMRDSALLDRIRWPRGPQDPPTLSVGTGAELSAIMAALHRGEVIDAAVSARVARWLAADADLSMVAAAFGLDPLAHADPDRGITLINKTGTIATARIDIGTADGPAGAVAYAVGANWSEAVDPRDGVLAAMTTIGHRIRVAIGAGA